MKACAVAAAVACVSLAQGVSATARHHLKASGVSFGPRSCVTLARSAGGSCVISTDCEGLDTSATEFAFDCVGQSGDGGIVRHSFGVGGFEANEEFDTEVKCDRCDKPTAAVEAAAAPPQKQAAAPRARRAAPPPAEPKSIPKPAPVYVAPPAAQSAPQTAQPFLAHELPTKPPRKPAQPKVEVMPRDVPGSVIFKAKHRSKHQSGSAASQKMWPFSSNSAPKVPSNPFTPGSEVVRYGPDGCVSVYKSAEGHCIMKTACTDVDISHYEFGLVCVDKVGSPVRHLFGKDSFDPEETFDTLIKCDQCLGLEDIPDAVALNGEVMTMSKDISNLKAVMTNISINVQMLNTEVFGGGPGPAPAPAAPAPAKKAEKALVHHSSQHRRMGASSRQQHRGGDVNFGARRHNLRHSRGRRVQEQQRHEVVQQRQVEVEDDRDDDRAQQEDRSNDEQEQDDRNSQAVEAQSNDDREADDADRRDRQSEEEQPAPVQASSDRDEDSEGYDTGSAPANNNAQEEVIRDDDEGEQ